MNRQKEYSGLVWASVGLVIIVVGLVAVAWMCVRSSQLTPTLNNSIESEMEDDEN